ncbi:MAG: hypothetical protein JO215_16445 [Ktedonobacteraceae bacterium]|nr:hypothetical protein [Ktedonobacteraceae bacterium]
MSNDPYQQEQFPYTPPQQGGPSNEQQGPLYPQSGQPIYPPASEPTIYPSPPPPPPPPPGYQTSYGYSSSSQPVQPSYPSTQYGSAPSAPPRKRRRTGVILSIVGLIVLLIVVGIIGLVILINHNPATDVVNGYYTALKNQNYTQAYSYLDSNLRLNSNQQPLTQDVFVQGTQDIDRQKGKISSYTITSTNMSSNNGVNTGQFTLSVTRKGPSYYVHLGLKDEGGQWKIVSFDTI